MKRVLLWAIVLLCASCHKAIEAIPNNSVVDTAAFIKYTIKAGGHYASHELYKSVKTKVFAFLARFDSSAIYQSIQAENQYDINKLYGFSDNDSAHHRYSARFGWRWSNGALRLFAYVYNAGQVTSEELGAVPIGADIKCRIEVTADTYEFYCNEYRQTMPRKSKTSLGEGYLLYPYFGGDEAAPHDVNIWIKDL